MAEYVSPDSSSGVYGTGIHDRICDASARIADLENEIKADIKVLMEKQSEIIHAINNIKDDRQRTVLELHYINGWNFYKIARKMNYSVDWVYTLHGRGLENLKKENK